MNLILQAIKSMFRKVNMMFNQLSNKVEIAQTNAVEAKALAEKQSDWNQNNEAAPDYIKNRTHYEIEKREIILPETTLNFTQTGHSGMQQITNISNLNLIENETYVVTWDNTEYLCTAHSFSGEAIGNNACFMGTTDEEFNPDAPFFIWNSGNVVPYDIGEHTFKIEKTTKEVHKLDKKFLPDDIGATPDWNQIDETAHDYIKNKPFGDTGETHLLAENKLPDHDSSYCGLPYHKFESDASYYLKVDEVNYQGFISDGYNTLDFYNNDGTRIAALFSPENDSTSLELNLNYSYFNITVPLTFELIEVKCQKIDGKFLHVPDWNQNDENAPDYIKNKPFYNIETREVLVEETTFNVVNGRAEEVIRFDDYPDLGQTLTITFDGVEYESVMTIDSDACYWINFDTPQGLVKIYDNHTVYYNNNDGSHTIKIEKVSGTLKKVDSKFLYNADWEQSDINAPDYIKNKPLCDVEARETIVEETTFDIINGTSGDVLSGSGGSWSDPVGKTFIIIFDGIEYESVMTIDSDACYWLEFDTSDGHVRIYDGHTVYMNNDGTHTIKIEERNGVIKKIDGKFLYNADWNQNDENAPDYVKNRTHWRQAVDGPIVDTDLDFTTENIVNFSQEDANRIFNMRQDVVYQVMINDTIVHQDSIVFEEKGVGILLDKFLPIDTSYGFILLISPKDNIVRLSHNRIKGTEYAGVYHFTLKVAGDYIYNPIDSNYLPAALGHSTSAEGWAFHRYNENEALGRGSVAGGNRAKATGESSFAFGVLTEASGNYSMASGANAKANGASSVAVGTYTTANGHAQTALGRYNLIDETAPNSNSYGKYVHIVGNGTADISRSNAYTLDWNGLGWFAGGLKVGGAGQDDENAKEVALKEDIAPAVEEAVAGMKDDLVSDVLSALPMWEGGNY